MLVGLIAGSASLGALQSLEAAQGAPCSWCDPHRDAAAGAMIQTLEYEPRPEAAHLVEAGLSAPSSERVFDPLAAPTLALTSPVTLSNRDDWTSTSEFVRQVSMSDTLDVRASLVAAAWANDPSIRALARQVIEERRPARERLARLADASGYATAGRAFDARHAAQLTKLRLGANGTLDQAYLELLSDSHAKAAIYYEAYAKTGENPELRTFAQSRLVTVRAQLAWLDKLTMG